MNGAGIICECNPFHSGHKHLITQAHAEGNAVICVMSGYFTQRGEAAIVDPYLRAEALVRGGADLVLELPYPYSAAGADFFADAGVEILTRVGASTLWFGSECGDLSRLSAAADATLSDEFATRYAKTADRSVGSAQAYFDILNELCGKSEPFLSNDILGISYLRALKRSRSSMRPITVRREGSAYLDGELHPDGHPSATALRRLLLTEGVSAAARNLPPETAEILLRAAQTGCFPADLRFAEQTVLTYLRLCRTDGLSHLAELGGGLGNRLIDAASRAVTLDELMTLAATKKYTQSRLRRGLLFALTGVKKEDLTASPAYVNVLAANAVGCAYLASQRRSASLPLITRNADIPNDSAALAQRELREAALALYAACLRKPIPLQSLLARNPVILK